jgi:trypsin-like peptidase
MRRLSLVVLSVAAVVMLGGPSSVSATQTWAPASSATIHPGVQLLTKGAQCTANFIFTDATRVFVGQAAHCSGTGGNTESDGCSAPSLPLGTPVTIPGASHPGTIVYSSWLTMQALKETDPSVCQYNDLALVQLDPADVRSVNPSIPIWGGPVGLDTTGTTAGERVYAYGHSKLAMGVSLLSPKQGVSLGDSGDGWSHAVMTLTPGIPGDSGSAYLDAQGRALGVLSTLELAPLPASNGVGDLFHELTYLHTHSGFTGVQLAMGTEPFAASPLGALGR